MEDLNDIHELHLKPETDEFNTLGIPEDLKETKHVIVPWINNHSDTVITKYTMAIEQNNDGAFVGLIALWLGNPKYKKGEVWYKLDSTYRGLGYATEVLSCLLDFGFEKLGLHRIEAGCAVNNFASIKVLEKVGMIREGSKRKVLPLKSGWADNFEYAILETDRRLVF